MFTCPIRLEPIYVGKGAHANRPYTHLTRTDKSPFVHRLNWIRKRGQQPIIEILCDGVDDELASLVEIEAISKYGRKDLGKGPLLNLTDGGDGIAGYRYTPEQRENVSSATKVAMADPEVRHKCSMGRKGKKNTQEHVKRSSEVHLGAKRTSETRLLMSERQKASAKSNPERYKLAWETRRRNATHKE